MIIMAFDPSEMWAAWAPHLIPIQGDVDVQLDHFGAQLENVDGSRSLLCIILLCRVDARSNVVPRNDG